MTVKDKMRMLRRKARLCQLSQAEIARQCKCSRQYIHMVLTGRRPGNPALRNLISVMIDARWAGLARMFTKKRKAS